jgi:hypothetical protein
MTITTTAMWVGVGYGYGYDSRRGSERQKDERNEAEEARLDING